ncbi:MAG: NAD(P)H-dependent oxidoreductase [Muribaculaceae bacterium]|nr:NAD(P)H-dependent oxidoreductase [Muribaculaceae bacterium]
MRTMIVAIFALLAGVGVQSKTLVVYYSYTNNVERIVDALRTKIDADVLEIEPAEKGLDYAADNYAIGSAQIAAIRDNPDDASSYPAIDPVDVNLSDYDCIIVGAPLWWSNMAAPLQTFLFQHGKEMAGKKIGLIVSSASSGISGVEADARRLIPGGDFLSPSLWIRSSQTSNAGSMLDNWLKEINYDTLTSGISHVSTNPDERYTVYSLSGSRLLSEVGSTEGLSTGIYIINGKKTIISK